MLGLKAGERMTEDEMVEWHHQLNGHKFEQTPGDSEGQGRLVCCSSWGRKELDTTEQLNNNDSCLGIEEGIRRARTPSQAYLC